MLQNPLLARRVAAAPDAGDILLAERELNRPRSVDLIVAPGVGDIHLEWRDECRPRSGEALIAAVAERQWGVISRAQLILCGLGSATIGRWVQRGRLRPIYRGVYAYGHRSLRLEGWLYAAVLACGPGAALSHQTGAAWFLMRQGFPSRPQLSAPRSRGRGPSGVRLHRPRLLLPEDVVTHEGIPVTSPARILLDSAATDRPHRLRAKIAQAERHRIFDLDSVNDVVERNRGHHGAAKLMKEIEGFKPEPDLRQQLERRFHRLMAASDLPPYEPNVPFGPFLLDAFFRAHRVGVELDGYDTHGNYAAFVDDRARDRYMAIHRVTVLRFTWVDVDEAPATLAQILR